VSVSGVCWVCYSSSSAEANPNVSGKDSTSSTTSTGSEGSTSDSDGSEIEGTLDVTDDDRSPTSHDRASGLVSLKVDVTWLQDNRHGTSALRGVPVYSQLSLLLNYAYLRVLMPPGKSLILFLKIPGPEKSWKITLILESPGKISLKVMQEAAIV